MAFGTTVSHNWALEPAWARVFEEARTLAIWGSYPQSSIPKMVRALMFEVEKNRKDSADLKARLLRPSPERGDA